MTYVGHGLLLSDAIVAFECIIVDPMYLANKSSALVIMISFLVLRYQDCVLCRIAVLVRTNSRRLVRRQYEVYVAF